MINGLQNFFNNVIAANSATAAVPVTKAPVYSNPFANPFLNQTLNQMNKIAGNNTVTLLENDLPDNYL